MKCNPELCGWVEDTKDLPHMWGYAWYCGDEYCMCSQARISTFERRNGPAFYGGKVVWEGTFETDACGTPTRDLNRMAQHLRRHHHDLYARINWPWNR